jgi:hypothetical protein
VGKIVDPAFNGCDEGASVGGCVGSEEGSTVGITVGAKLCCDKPKHDRTEVDDVFPQVDDTHVDDPPQP